MADVNGDVILDRVCWEAMCSAALVSVDDEAKFSQTVVTNVPVCYMDRIDYIRWGQPPLPISLMNELIWIDHHQSTPLGFTVYCPAR